MTAIATGKSAYGAIAALLANEASASETAMPRGKAAASASPASNDPLDTIELSDRARATLARAKSEQAVVDRLAAQVDAFRGVSDARPVSLTDRIAKWAPTLKTTVTLHDSPAPYGDPTTSDAQFIKDMSLDVSLPGLADTYDKEGFPPEIGQAMRNAVANGTLKIQSADDVAGLNMHSTNIYSPGAISPSTWGTTTQHPTGAIKEALDQGKALAMWTADRGNVYLTWPPA